MNFGTYSFRCSFKTHAVLPEYKGSTFRGCFGRALKQAVCVLRTRSCDDCLLSNQCLYAKVFETLKNPPSHESSRMAAQPHPFVIEPPETRNTHFSPGDDFSFNILLFGQAIESLPYFIHAVILMGQESMGKRIGPNAGQFDLTSVWRGQDKLYNQDDKKLHQVPAISLNLQPAPSTTFDRLKIQFHTPLRLKHENRFASELPFHLLIRAVLRRISSLLACYDGAEPALDYRGLVADAGQVSIAESSLHWMDWRRYSFRQRQDMQMGGIIGDVLYIGNLQPFLPFLEFCRVVHIGKQTTFGLGRFDMDPDLIWTQI
jgi:CRISPR-associated endoribonuclease Cas6